MEGPTCTKKARCASRAAPFLSELDLQILPFVQVSQAKRCTFLVESCTFDRQTTERGAFFNFSSTHYARDILSYSWRSKVQLSTKKVQLFACDTTTKGKIGRCNVHKKGAARFARRAFFVRVGPSNFAFFGSVTGETLHLFGRKLHL